MSDYSIGVDLGGTNLRIAAVDNNGKLLEKLTLGTEVKRGRDFVISEMVSAIQSLRTKYNGVGNLMGMGIGVPGFIDMDTGTVMDSPNLPDRSRRRNRYEWPLVARHERHGRRAGALHDLS